MSVRYYLPVRHDVVAKTVLKALILKIDLTDKFRHVGGIFLLKLQQSYSVISQILLLGIGQEKFVKS